MREKEDELHLGHVKSNVSLVIQVAERQYDIVFGCGDSETILP